MGFPLLNTKVISMKVASTAQWNDSAQMAAAEVAAQLASN